MAGRSKMILEFLYSAKNSRSRYLDGESRGQDRSNRNGTLVLVSISLQYSVVQYSVVNSYSSQKEMI